MSKRTIPLAERRGDMIILTFFIVNLLFITYMVDIEQLIIPNPYHFTYPTWPPPMVVDAVHWYGSTFDPVLMARPAWWKATIWIDVLFFGPFYVFAIYAFIKGKNWIRIPSIIYASMLLTNVLIILSEEMYGSYATPQLPLVLAVNLPWLLFPIFIIYRMASRPEPFTRAAEAPPTSMALSRSFEVASPSGGD